MISSLSKIPDFREAFADAAKEKAAKRAKVRVYIADYGEGIFKIGRTDQVEKRIKNLQALSPILILSVHVSAPSETAISVEGILHREFRSDRMHSEFFRGSAAKAVEALRKHLEVEQIIDLRKEAA